MRFWTRQHEAVWDELQKTGQYIVKKEYIEAKNDTISEFYLKLYEWYTKAARKYIDIPEVLKYPIWLSVRQKIIKSWDRIFTIQPDDPSLMVGTCWKLKKEWIKEVRFYDGE